VTVGYVSRTSLFLSSHHYRHTAPVVLEIKHIGMLALKRKSEWVEDNTAKFAKELRRL
jgi:hypothetical protein